MLLLEVSLLAEQDTIIR